MTLFACGLLALGVLAYMISPMLDGSVRRPRIARSALSRRDDLLKKKDFIYSSIRELNIDYNMGKLAAEDYEALRQEYMKEASDVLDELDRTAVSDLPVEEQIEEAVRAVREIRQRRDPASGEAVTVDDVAAEEKVARRRGRCRRGRCRRGRTSSTSPRRKRRPKTRLPKTRSTKTCGPFRPPAYRNAGSAARSTSSPPDSASSAVLR